MRKTKCIITALLIITSSKIVLSEVLLDIKWGESPPNINYFTVPDGRYGIADFYVDGDEIGILDVFNHQLHIFNSMQEMMKSLLIYHQITLFLMQMMIYPLMMKSLLIL